MGKHNKTRRDGKAPRHIRLYHYFTDSPAWHDLNAVARVIYIDIARRYMGSNNGRIPYAVREAAVEFKISTATASRALAALVDHGFIVPTIKGAFSLKKRHATEWRLTEVSCDVTGALASKEFMRWQPQTSRFDRYGASGARSASRLLSVTPPLVN
jgi:DNA-binding transcriptional regulator YhcF (GntR family)